jgi:hypothetical protein
MDKLNEKLSKLKPAEQIQPLSQDKKLAQAKLLNEKIIEAEVV